MLKSFPYLFDPLLETRNSLCTACTITQVTYSCILFTIERYVQEESVRDVQHGAAQQIEDINVSQAVQVVQVSLYGGDANIRRLLQIWACQS